MAYTGESLAAKTVRANGSKILEFFQFGCGESLAENGKVIALYKVRKDHSRGCREWYVIRSHINPMSIIRDLK